MLLSSVDQVENRMTQDHSRKYCVIVDAYSGGSLFAPHFHELGLSCIHVQSRGDIPKMMLAGFRSGDFVANFLYAGDIDELLKKLKEYNPLFVMPGYHGGVYLAEELGTKLNVPSNNSKSTDVRMDKFQMQKRLAECEIRHAKSFITSDRKELIEIYREQFEEKEVIVKPTRSAGTEHVFFCDNMDEVTRAFDCIINKTNAMALVNDTVLVQEFLKGQEYMINTVTIDGHHVTTDIWRSDKNWLGANRIFYDKAVLLEAEGSTQDVLCRYNNSVLDALEFEFGPSHNEIMYTENGPVLIEMNSRISGGHLPEITLECTGLGQVGWTRRLAESLVTGTSVKPEKYRLDKKAYCVTLVSKDRGMIAGFKNIDRIERLKSFHSIDMRVNIGDWIVETIDVWTGPGLVVLIHDKPEVIHTDYLKLREIEDEGLYILQERTPSPC